jgi:DNA-binding NarL/FixJ family response regulator
VDDAHAALLVYAIPSNLRYNTTAQSVSKDGYGHEPERASSGPATAPGRRDREQAVLTLVGRGLTNRQIADALTISEKTVSVHVSNMFSMLELASRTQAALYAARSGLIPPGELA